MGSLSVEGGGEEEELMQLWLWQHRRDFSTLQIRSSTSAGDAAAAAPFLTISVR